MTSDPPGAAAASRAAEAYFSAGWILRGPVAVVPVPAAQGAIQTEVERPEKA